MALTVEERIAQLRRMRVKYMEQAAIKRAAGATDEARKLEKAATRTRDRIRELGGSDATD